MREAAGQRDVETFRQRLREARLLVFDFDGVFTDNTVYVSQTGEETVRCWRSDGLGLARVRGLGLPILIISTEKNPVVSRRAEKLRIPCTQGVDDKAVAILESCRDIGVPPMHTIFVGNDINDISAFKTVGLPIAVADAYPEVLEHVLYRTEKAGGRGAVREVCDLVYLSRTGRAARPE